MLQFERWKITLIVLTCLLGLVFVAPNFVAKDRLAGPEPITPTDSLRWTESIAGSGSFLEMPQSPRKRSMALIETAPSLASRLQRLSQGWRGARFVRRLFEFPGVASQGFHA